MTDLVDEKELDRIVEEINQHNYQSVVLQIPDGMRMGAIELAKELEGRTEAIVAVLADPCYGACDVFDRAERLGIDLVVHFGHSRIPGLGESEDVPVLFIPLNYEGKVEEAQKNLEKLQTHLKE